MTRSTAKRWTLGSLVLCLLLVIAVALGWPEVSHAVQGAVEGGVPQKRGGASAAQEGFEVSALVGEISVRSEGGAWRPLKLGQLLKAGQVIRTGDFSYSILKRADGSSFEVKQRTTFKIAEQKSAKSKFQLAEGRIAADLPRRMSGSYEILAAKGDAKVTTQEGQFQVVANRSGLLGVATERGEVALSAAGKTVTVGAGKQAVALAGMAPSKATSIPEEVFLRVRWPAGETRESRAKLEGNASLGSRVVVDGKAVVLRSDGSFEADAALKLGENRRIVVVEDLTGRVKRIETDALTKVEKKVQPLKLKLSSDGDIWE